MSTATSLQVAVTTTPTKLVDADSNRETLVIATNVPGGVLVGGAGLTVGNGYVLISVPLELKGKAAKAEIWGVAGSSGAIAYILEIAG